MLAVYFILIILIKCATTQTNYTIDDETARKHLELHRNGRFLKTVLDSTAEELANVRTSIGGAILHDVVGMNVSLRKKLVVWELYGRDRNLKTLTCDDLAELGEFIAWIPEDELLLINVIDTDVLNCLGSSTHLSRRKAAILAFSLVSKLGNIDVLSNTSIINDMKGLLCGFSERDMKKIKVDVLLRLESAVYNNLWPCSKPQLQILLNSCMLSHYYRHVELWTLDTVKHLGLLVLALRPEHIQKFEANVIAGLSADVVMKFDADQIRAFSKEQVAEFGDEARAAYNAMFLTYQSSCSHRLCRYLWIILLLCSAISL